MTAIDSRGGVVTQRTDFGREWRGFSRSQVTSYVDEVEADVRLLTADRAAAVARADELVRHVEQLQVENAQLQERIDRICRSPIEPDGLQDRFRRMVELARDEADEIVARAEAAAEDSWVHAEQAAVRLRERYERLDGELDTYRDQAEVEQEALIRRIEAQVESMAHRTKQRRRELDEQAERRRSQVERDFELAMTQRRNEAMRSVAERKAAATAEAGRLVEDAREQAARLVAAARRQVEVLFEIRDRTADQLHSTRDLLANAETALRSRPEGVMQSVSVEQVGEIPAARQPA